MTLRHGQAQSNLITAGQLAKLAGTTKRTIHFYHQTGVLLPTKISPSGYRLYQPRQVLDYQIILLLSTLGLSLAEIRSYLKDRGSLPQLFNTKKRRLRCQIESLKFDLDCLAQYMHNLQRNGTLVNPTIKAVKPLNLYYLDRLGPYSQIGKFCHELTRMFTHRGHHLTTLAIFPDPGYRPKSSRIQIATFAKRDIHPKPSVKSIVKQMRFKPGRVISHTHRGSSKMLSLFWQELKKYCRLHGHRIRSTTPSYEIYWRISPVPSQQKFEIFLPIH